MDPFLTQILYIIGFEVIILLLLMIIVMFDVVRVVREFRRVSERALHAVDEVTTTVQGVTRQLSSLINGAADMVGKPGKWFGKKKKKKAKKSRSEERTQEANETNRETDSSQKRRS